MAQIVKKFLSSDAVDGTKVKLLNNQYLRARNQADDGDIDLLKLNASQKIEFASLPQMATLPTVNADLANKEYVDSVAGGSAITALTGEVTASGPGSAAATVTNSAVIGKVITGYTSGSGTVAATDTILQAVQKLNGNDALKLPLAGGTMSGNIAMGGSKVTGLGAPSTNGDALRFDQLGANSGIATLDGGGKVPASQLPSTLMDYLGNWNASTNSPTLVDGTGSAGDVYLVSVAGSQNLGSGSITYAVGDWIIYNGTIWQKSLNSNAVVSVNGFTGTVVLSTTDIAEGTNKYQKTWGKENLTLDGTDITNQYKDLAQVIIASSLDLVMNGVMQVEATDYTVSLTGGAGGKTRITFAGDLATAGASALISGDIMRFKYQY